MQTSLELYEGRFRILRKHWLLDMIMFSAWSCFGLVICEFLDNNSSIVPNCNTPGRESKKVTSLTIRPKHDELTQAVIRSNWKLRRMLTSESASWRQTRSRQLCKRAAVRTPAEIRQWKWAASFGCTDLFWVYRTFGFARFRCIIRPKRTSFDEKVIRFSHTKYM